MNNLNYQDWQILVAALGDLHSDFDPRTLTERSLAAASKIIAVDSVAFTGFRYDGDYADLMWTNVREYSAEEMEVFAEFIHENPLFSAYILEHRTETLKITDLMPSRDFERTAIYNEFYRRVNVSNQLVTPMKISDEFLITCSMNIEKRDFSERDRLMLQLLAPHLASVIRNAFAYQRLNAALDTETCGIVALNSADKPTFVSDYAQIIFEKYFADEKCAAGELPTNLKNWLEYIKKSEHSDEFTAPPAPLKVVNQNGELTARCVYSKQTGERTLMLKEKRSASPEAFKKIGLTNREAEILFLITQGKSDEIIARLCGISPRTVHKHVQNIYIKLGVETRTAAMLKALENIY